MGAVELARTAIVEFSGDCAVGEYLGASFDDSDRGHPSLPGQHARLSGLAVGGGRRGAIRAPTTPRSAKSCWCPGRRRCWRRSGCRGRNALQPGDLARVICSPRPPTIPAWCPVTSLPVIPRSTSVAVELGLGRRQVLSELGRADAAQRWHDGDYGPGSTMARSTRRVCRDCGFYLPLPGSLGLMFGVCANEIVRRRARRGFRIRLRRTLGHPGSQPEPARRSTTRTTTACSTSSSRRPRATSRKPRPTTRTLSRRATRPIKPRRSRREDPARRPAR